MTAPVRGTEAEKIGVFFKRPVPGQVKTRLTPHLSADQAARLYEAFLLDTIALCRSLERVEVVLFDGSPVREPWAALPVDLDLVPQSGADLGARMTHALEVLLERGARKALLVGSDSPTLPPEHLRDALHRLDHVDLVLGPTLDGGFHLIGMRRPPGPLLEGIRWSTTSVLEETMARARDHEMTTSLTLPWFDVDTVDDLHRLRRDLEERDISLPRTRAALAALGS